MQWVVQYDLLRAQSAQNIGQYKEEPNWPETQDTKIRRRKTDRRLSNTQLGLNDSLLSKGEERILPRIFGKTESKEHRAIV